MQSTGLSHTRYTGFYFFAEGEIGYDLRKSLAVRRHIGPGAYKTHRPQEHIKKLRKLVQMG